MERDNIRNKLRAAGAAEFFDYLPTIWTTHRNPRAALKMARNFGEIDGGCRMIVQAAERLGVPALGVSPRQKGRKLDAGELCTLTGWAGRSNQHERDAAAVAWPYRSGWKR